VVEDEAAAATPEAKTGFKEMGSTTPVVEFRWKTDAEEEAEATQEAVSELVANAIANVIAAGEAVHAMQA
jgi:hypothetical protein